MTAPTPPQAERTQRVSDERLAQIAAFKPHAEHGDVANWVTMRHDELMALCAEAADSRAESARLRDAMVRLRAALAAAQKISAAAVNFVRAKHEDQEDFEDDLRLCVEAQQKSALVDLRDTAALAGKE